MGDIDPREQYLAQISIHKSRVNLTPPIIFLFGGKINTSPLQSVRGVLYDYILINHRDLSNNLALPEDFKDWLHDAAYPDLLTFESDLAQIASLIIIALESPGSIAELGAFAANPDLNQKLIIIMEEKHYNQKSFIKLGPLRLLPEKNVFSYPYETTDIQETLQPYLSDIISEVKNYLGKIDSTKIINSNNNGHIAMVITDLIVLFKALKFTEILSYLEILEIKLKQNELKRLLFLLKKLSLINSYKLGSNEYYVTQVNSPRATFSSKDKSRLFDRTAAIIGTTAYYKKSNKEKMRYKIIERHFPI